MDNWSSWFVLTKEHVILIEIIIFLMQVTWVAANSDEVCRTDWHINTACASCYVIAYFLSLFDGILLRDLQE